MLVRRMDSFTGNVCSAQPALNTCLHFASLAWEFVQRKRPAGYRIKSTEVKSKWDLVIGEICSFRGVILKEMPTYTTVIY